MKDELSAGGIAPREGTGVRLNSRPHRPRSGRVSASAAALPL